jgi:splicing factor 3A subunit 1
LLTHIREIIKLTAIFVARNGKQFMTTIAQREVRNPQFDFLKPTHPYFAFFTRLVEQYTNILIPKNITDTLAQHVADKFSVTIII